MLTSEAQSFIPGVSSEESDDLEAMGDMPTSVIDDLRLLMGGAMDGDFLKGIPTGPKAPVETEEVEPGTLQHKFIEARSKTKVDYSITDMAVRVFDLADQAQALQYAEFTSEHFARMMTDPKVYRFSETPVQLIPIDGGVRAVVVVKCWKQVVTPSLHQPHIDKIPKGGIKHNFSVSLTPAEQ